MYFSRIQLRSGEVSRMVERLRQGSYEMHRLFWELFTEDGKRNFLFREEVAREQLELLSGARGEPVYYVVSATQPIADHPIFYVDIKNYQPKLKPGDRLHFELRANPVVSRNGKKHDVPMDTQRQFLDSLCTEMSLQTQVPARTSKQGYKQLLLRNGGKKLDEKLTLLLENSARYADRLDQSLTLTNKLEWAIKAKVDEALERWMVLQSKQHGFVICQGRDDQLKLQSSGYRWHSLKEKDRSARKPGFSSVDFVGVLEVTDAAKFRHALFCGIGPAKAFG